MEITTFDDVASNIVTKNHLFEGKIIVYDDFTSNVEIDHERDRKILPKQG